MVKDLKKYHVILTPFNAAKKWSLNNIENNELLLFESTIADDGEPLALEYIDYNEGNINTNCNIALEQQNDDKILFQEGEKLTGPFYPNIDPININGTYKRVIYAQIKTTFYNNYINPTQILGIDNIDIENSTTKRKLSDKVRILDIPRIVFGDKVIPNTLKIYDSTLDNNYTIIDDSNGNLIIDEFVFSNQQETGDFQNQFNTGSSNNACDQFLSSVS